LIKMKALLLLSSGIDSPVAGYLMQKQGYQLQAVHFEHTKDKKNLEKVKQLAKKISIRKLFLINNLKNQKEIAAKCNHRYQCLICKRLMYRIAEALAKKENIDVLITGENLGQVASQTLPNLIALDKAVNIKILRPLLAFDKTEIIKISRKLSTYDISKQKSADCPFVPKKPITQAKLQIIEQEESRINLQKIIENNLSSVKIINSS